MGDYSVLPENVWDALQFQKQEAQARIDFLTSKRMEIAAAACLEIDAEIAAARKDKDRVMVAVVDAYIPHLDRLGPKCSQSINTTIQNTILTYEDEILGEK